MKRLASAIVAAAVAAVPYAALGQSSEIKVLNTFDGRYPATPLVLDKFVETMKAASKGKMTFRASGPEVVPAAEQFQPVQKGAFDVLFTVQPWHSNVSSASMGIYALEPDPEGWRQNGLYDFLDREYQRHNMKMLAIVPGNMAGNGTFQAVLKEEVKPGQDLTGRKLRGIPTYKGFTDQLGATIVTLQGGEVYAALQRGSVDGVLWPVVGAIDFKWYEQAKFMLRPRWGTSYHFLFMNLDRFNKFDAADRALFVEEGRKAELAGQKALDERLRQELVALSEKGMKETTIDKDKFERARDGYNQGAWNLAFGSKAGGEQAKEFHAFLKSKGIVK